MRNLAELPDRELVSLYYERHDQMGCTLCAVPAAGISPEQRAELALERQLVAAEIFRRNFSFLCRYFRRYRIFLKEEPQWLATEAIARALHTEHRRAVRYDCTRPFRPWLLAIALRVRLDHPIRQSIFDAELVQRFLDGKLARERFRVELDDRYRQILTDWFRKGMKACGVSTRPEKVAVLVDETFEQVLSRVGEFDPDRVAFIVWLSRIAKAVLAVHAIQPVRNLADVPEHVGGQHVPLEEELAAPEDPPDEFTNPRLLDCWQRLTPRERQVLWAVDVEGETAKEVAERLQVAVGTVFNTLSRGRQRLRECVS